MSKFLTYNNVARITDTFLGVAQDEIEGRVISSSTNNATIIQVKDQKPLIDWNFNKPLSTRVHFDKKLSKYVGIFNKCFMKLWDAETTNVAKIKKIPLYRDVVDLVQADDGRVMILYKNCFCESVESALASPNRSPARENREIELLDAHQVTFARVEDIGRYVTFFCTIQGDVEMQFIQLQDEDLQPTGTFKRVKVTTTKDKAVGYCVLETHKKPSLLTFREDGRLYRHQFLEKLNKEEKIEAISTLNIIHPHTKISMAPISGDLVAVYAATKNLDGALLFLFNTEYKVVQSKHYFKVHFKNGRVFSFDSNVFLVAGEYLSVIPFKVTKDKIADLIGSKKVPRDSQASHANFESYEESQGVMEEMAFDDEATGLEVMKAHKIKNIKEVNPSIFKATSEIEINNDLRKIIRDRIAFEMIESDEVSEPKLQVFSNIANFGQLSSALEGIIDEFVKQGMSEMEIVDNVVPTLIEAKQNGDLSIILKRFLNISEKTLAKVLKFAVETNDSSLINDIISCSFDSATIVPHLRENLNFLQVSTILRHLMDLYKSPDTELTNKCENDEDFDADTRILNWSCVLIDASYQQILLAKNEEFLKLVLEWRQIVKKHQKALVELESLRALVQEVYAGRYGKTTKANQFYSIEKILLE